MQHKVGYNYRKGREHSQKRLGAETKALMASRKDQIQEISPNEDKDEKWEINLQDKPRGPRVIQYTQRGLGEDVKEKVVTQYMPQKHFL